MDKHFLEFWGNVMLATAKGQQQLDDIMKWFSGNFGEFKDITDLFCKMYGIEPQDQKSPGVLPVWHKAFADFQRSFSELTTMMDLVPRKEYIDLSQENQELKKRIAQLEEGNAHLRAMLSDKVATHGSEGIKGFQELINEQAKQYQDFMKSINEVFEAKPTKAQAAPKPKPQPVLAGEPAHKAQGTAKPTTKAVKKK